MGKAIISEYIREIEQALQRGDATEHTHRPVLKRLLEEIENGVAITNEPKRIECGAPDFIVSRRQTTVGYVEAKDVGVSLDEALKTDQLRRYRESLGNLVLTNYLEFRWFVDGVERGSARLGSLGPKGKVVFDRSGGEVLELLRSFYALKVPSVRTPKDLAERIARLGRMMRNLIVQAFQKEPEGGALHSQLTAFRETLIPDLGPEQFADMYAQTIAYGLFAARAMESGNGTFARQSAAWMLPKTNPFLRSLFNHIAGPDLDDRIAWLADDLARLLAEADMAAVLEDFGKRAKREDPVVHFYESFLQEYDPRMREMRGVYYTPEPVVSYIVRSVDHLLQERFECWLGLADPDTLVLDPAVGTGTFLYSVVNLIHERLQEQGQLGVWNSYVAEKLLPRLFGFELLMAPYAIAHLKLGLVLKELGYQFASDQRLGIYLTNTLEEAIQRSELLFARYIAEEAKAAVRIKADEPIMVVLGNPPYSGHSANKGKWIGGLLRDYYQVDGQPLQEKNPKWLQDDYVKFIRFGQWRIERTGQGILAFVTNHSYLDNPTFRGMRQSLLNTFTDVCLLNLHGNTKKRERTPAGGPDENVFDIQQGVAIGIFVKEPGKSGPAKVHYADLWGEREGKYAWLAEHDVTTTDWTELSPASPFYLFTPQDTDLLAEYERGWKVNEIMPTNSVGIVTSRDHFVFDFDETMLQARIEDFLSPAHRDDTVRTRYLTPRDKLNVSVARKAIRHDGDTQKAFTRCLYRPFDVRPLFYHDAVIERSRREVMRHMLAGENLGLITVRQVAEGIFNHVLVTKSLVESRIMLSNKGIGFLFPLYLYPGDEAQGQLALAPSKRRPNLNPKFIADMEQRLGLSFTPDGRGDLETTFGPEDVFYYIYAVLHSPTYRSRYAEYLKIDFPRVPLTSNRELFATLVEKGAELVTLHLLKSPALRQVGVRFPEKGSNTVEKIQYLEQEKRVWINETQYFGEVEPEAWRFHVGGYQVCEKWLKDRRGRRLSYDDVVHYQKVVAAIQETIRLMKQIDALCRQQAFSLVQAPKSTTSGSPTE